MTIPTRNFSRSLLTPPGVSDTMLILLELEFSVVNSTKPLFPTRAASISLYLRTSTTSVAVKCVAHPWRRLWSPWSRTTPPRVDVLCAVEISLLPRAGNAPSCSGFPIQRRLNTTTTYKPGPAAGDRKIGKKRPGRKQFLPGLFLPSAAVESMEIPTPFLW